MKTKNATATATEDRTAAQGRDVFKWLTQGKIKVKVAVAVALIVLITAIVVFAMMATALDAALEGFTIHTGENDTDFSVGSISQPVGNNLQRGEVRVGKSVEHNIDWWLNSPNGTVTVTLFAWARDFVDIDGIAQDPLRPMNIDGKDVYVQVIDDIGEFAVLGSLPAGLRQEGNQIIWEIENQSAMMGGNQHSISYTLTVVNPDAGHPPDWTMDYWYSTGIGSASFMPAVGNPYYWTMTETMTDAFNVSMSWNNGRTGLNSGAIIDNYRDITIQLPGNQTPAGMEPYDQDNLMNVAGQWNWWPQNVGTRAVRAATVQVDDAADYYTWHLKWQRFNDVDLRTNLFTIRDLDGPGIDVQYELHFTNPGGSESMPGGRTRISIDYFHRSFNANQEDLFFWEDERVVLDLNAIGQIRLTDDRVFPEFEMTVEKAFGTDGYHTMWLIDDDTQFVLHMKNDTSDLYLSFQNPSPGVYVYNGLATEPTPVYFSKNVPAQLTGMPVQGWWQGDYRQITYSLAEHFTWDPETPRQPQVDVTYAVDGELRSEPVIFNPSAGEEKTLVVTNTFVDPAFGQMRLMKTLGGFPAYWGIDGSQEFQVKIWDAYAEVYLLFVQPDEQAITDGWDSPGWIEGTLFCVGNTGSDQVGAGSASWVFSDPYWKDRYQSGTADVFTAFFLFELQEVKLSNLWPGDYEVRELDFSNPPGLLRDSPRSYVNGGEWMDMYRFDGSYADYGTVPPADAVNVIVANLFSHPAGQITVFKQIEGHPEDWNVNDDTEFTVYVRDLHPTLQSWRLLFANHSIDSSLPDNETWRHVGYISIDDGARMACTYYPWDGNLEDAVYALPISVNSPLVLTQMHVEDGRSYIFEEDNDGGHVVRFFVDGKQVADDGTFAGIILDPGESRIATMVNSYLRAVDSRAAVFKQLAGAYAEYDIDGDTDFELRMTDVNAGSNGRLLLFMPGPDEIVDDVSPPIVMRSFTLRGQLDPITDEVWLLVVNPANPADWSWEQSSQTADELGLVADMKFSVNKPSLIHGLVPGDYLLEECNCPDMTYAPTITEGSSLRIGEKDVLAATVTNTFRSIYTPPELDPEDVAIWKLFELPTHEETPEIDFVFDAVPYSFNGDTSRANELPQLNQAAKTISFDQSDTGQIISGIKVISRLSAPLLDGVEFERAGVYTYRISERDDSFVPGERETMVFDSRVWQISFIVQNMPEPSTDVHLMSVQIEEVTIVEGEEVLGGKRLDGIIPFRNVFYYRPLTDPTDPELAPLTISKVVAGDYGNQVQFFAFTMELAAPDLVEEPAVYKAYVVEDGAVVTSVDNGYVEGPDQYGYYLLFHSGLERDFFLRHNQVLVFVDAYFNSGYWVTEHAVPIYRVSAEVLTGGVPVPVQNPTSPGTPLTIDGEFLEQGRNSVDFTNTNYVIPPTGLFTGTAKVSVLIVVLAIVSLLLGSQRIKRKRLELDAMSE
ncbi:MAG: hypothetical protein FWC81_01020 [Coriobacteriia bacterium]|nr:hypothetical protein [Coriobacteriia bacterium]